MGDVARAEHDAGAGDHIRARSTQRRSGIKTQSTPRPDGAKSRFHMLRFDDSFHEEQWLMRSQGRMDVTAFSNYFEKVYGNRHINIGGKDPDTGKGGGRRPGIRMPTPGAGFSSCLWGRLPNRSA